MRNRHQYRMLQAAFVFALVGIAFFGAHSGNVLTRQFQVHPEERPAEAHKQHHRPGESPMVQDEKNHEDGRAKQAWSDKFLDHLPDWFVAFFTFLLVFVTWRLVTSTNKLWEAGERQIAVAETAAKAAKKSAEAAERSLTHLERPYIFIFGVHRIEEDGDGDFYIRYSVANYGKTPAILDSVRVSIFHTVRGEVLDPPEVSDSHALSVSPIIQSGEVRTALSEYVWGGLYRGIDQAFTSPSGDFVNVPVFEVPSGESVMMRVVIQYHGPFSGPHETGTMWLHIGDGLFAVRGRAEHNYQK